MAIYWALSIQNASLIIVMLIYDSVTLCMFVKPMAAWSVQQCHWILGLGPGLAA